MDFTPETQTADNLPALTHDSGGRITGRSKLTTQQRAFVNEYIVNGGDGTKAAEKAGYSFPQSSQWSLKQLPHIQQAIHESRERELSELATLGLKVVREILLDKGAPYGVRANLAKSMIEGKHGVRVQELDKLAEKRIDEMSLEELVEHGRKLDKLLADTGLLIDIPETLAQSDAQPIENNEDTTV